MNRELVKWIEERAILRGDCWIWRLALVRGDTPQGRYQGKSVYVRRVIIESRKGDHPLPYHWFAGCTCGTVGCVRPEHITAQPRTEVEKGTRKSAIHGAKVAAGKQAAGKLDWEKVAEIRESDESIRAIAARMGVHFTYISQIRNHRVWRETGMFSGLGSRA